MGVSMRDSAGPELGHAGRTWVGRARGPEKGSGVRLHHRLIGAGHTWSEVTMAAAKGPRRGRSPWEAISTFDEESGALNAVIETVQGSRCKLSLNHELGVFAVKEPMPAGAEFPCDFGFVPG